MKHMVNSFTVYVALLKVEWGWQFQDDDPEFFEEDLEGDGDFSVEGINPIELESSAIAEGMVYPPEATGEEFGTVEETKEFLQGSQPRVDTLYNPEKENQKYGVLRETDPEWESMFKAGTVDARLLEELKSVTETIKFEDNAPIPAGESAPANGDVWKDTMEEDTMALEPGLVYFSVSIPLSTSILVDRSVNLGLVYVSCSTGCRGFVMSD
jgi:hypothetical protein